jgi:hypothetical protein
MGWRRILAPRQEEGLSSISSPSGFDRSFFCSTEQLPDIHVETPNLGSTHFWRTTQATTMPKKMRKSFIDLEA